jgi:hypothetical protein
MGDGRTYEQVRRNFTERELAEMHEQLVVCVGNVKDLRAEKTQANSTINAAIKTAEKSVWDCQEKLALGYEVVDTEVIAAMDTPRPGMKRIVRVDTNETIREEPMTARERQGSFGFTEPE